MKKTILTLSTVLCAGLLFISCQNETTSGNNEDTKKDTTAEKIELYKKALLGTTWEEKSNTKEGFDGYETLAFKESSVVLGGTEYPIDVTKDLYYYNEIPDAANTVMVENEFYILVNNVYLGFECWIWENLDYLGLRLPDHHFNSYKLVSSSGSSTSDGSSTETVTVSGKYTINQANGSTISFSDGNWTYSYLSSTKSGSYSQSGNELTMNYSAGGSSVSGVFTVAKDGSNVKLTGKSGDYTTIVSSAFMVKDSDALTNGVVTLTAK